MEIDETRYQEIKALVESSPAVRLAQLPFYYLPYSQNPGFFGQRQALDECKRNLTGDGGLTGLRSYALYGVGGVGKTSIALQFAYESKGAYRVILWFAADAVAKLAQGFSEVATTLCPQRSPTNSTQLRVPLKTWLHQTGEIVLPLLNYPPC